MKFGEEKSLWKDITNIILSKPENLKFYLDKVRSSLKKRSLTGSKLTHKRSIHKQHHSQPARQDTHTSDPKKI
jgi:hypothetical protein